MLTQSFSRAAQAIYIYVYILWTLEPPLYRYKAHLCESPYLNRTKWSRLASHWCGLPSTVVVVWPIFVKYDVIWRILYICAAIISADVSYKKTESKANNYTLMAYTLRRHTLGALNTHNQRQPNKTDHYHTFVSLYMYIYIRLCKHLLSFLDSNVWANLAFAQIFVVVVYAIISRVCGTRPRYMVDAHNLVWVRRWFQWESSAQ